MSFLENNDNVNLKAGKEKNPPAALGSADIGDKKV
jgi:hypothetical protein